MCEIDLLCKGAFFNYIFPGEFSERGRKISPYFRVGRGVAAEIRGLTLLTALPADFLALAGRYAYCRERAREREIAIAKG